jgi:tetratricopeptide (TPR) repeat protein
MRTIKIVLGSKKTTASIFVWLLVQVPAAWAAKQHLHEAAFDQDQLGTISFPTSCRPSVQPEFERGIALLHSFAYNRAAEQFKQVEQKDPGCAMAYWGEAMTLYKQLWDRPSDSELRQGYELIRKAETVGPKTERERGYIETAAGFFQSGKLSYETRWRAYSEALGRLCKRYPTDEEAAIFYALSLIASPHAEDNDFAERKEAVAILDPLFNRQPNHPGVAHYLIHACDNPEMAQLGLPAARRYALVAPGSPHALHMPSHIFARLGLWHDDIDSNLASKAAAEAQSSTHDRVHAMDFLMYAYLQTGQDSKARDIESEVLEIDKRAFSEDMQAVSDYSRVHFPALFALERHAWKEAESLHPPPGTEPQFQAVTYWANAIGASHVRDVDRARSAVEQYDRALFAVRKGSHQYIADAMSITRDEAHAWLAFAQGDSATAIRLLEATADQQDRVGKGEVDIPAREMLADMLLDLHRADDALTQYQRSLHTDPNRFNALYGAARSAELAGRRDLAESYYQQLVASCKDADSGESARPELGQAKAYLNITQ